MQSLLSNIQDSPHSSIDSLIHKDSLLNLTIRDVSPDMPYKYGMEYYGSDKIDDLIEYINYLSQSTKGSFGQDLKPVSYWDMPEAGRLSDKALKQLSDEELYKYHATEERETSTKAAILYDLLKRNQYDYGVGGIDVEALRSDYLSER